MTEEKVAAGGIQLITPNTYLKVLRWALPAHKNVACAGRPGIGKTQITEQIAKELDADYFAFHPSVDDVTDYKGFPWIVTKDNITEAHFLPIGNLKNLLTAKKLTIAVLEDFGQAPPSIQGAAMQMVGEEKRLGEQKISDNVVFIINTNRRQDQAAVAGLLEPIKSRMGGGLYHLDTSVDDWVEWARLKGYPVWFLAHAKFRPSFLLDWEPSKEFINTSCPRTVAAVGDAILTGCPESEWFTVFSGIAGQGYTADLLSFHKIYRDLPNIDSITSDPLNAPIPQKADVQWALCAAMAARAKKKTFKPMITYFDRWLDRDSFKNTQPRNEFVLFWFKELDERHPELQENDDYNQWIIDHNSLYR